jgi:hypothetical protein
MALILARSRPGHPVGGRPVPERLRQDVPQLQPFDVGCNEAVDGLAERVADLPVCIGGLQGNLLFWDF